MSGRRDPVERFLGTAEAGGGPFRLLGLDPTETGDDTIIYAMNAQLARTNEHPEADTPEADEVRLAIHAAAAQLLDPVVRRHMLAQYHGVAPGSDDTPPAQPVNPRIDDHTVAIEHDALLTLARYGGWNRESLRRLTWLAHARGITNDEVRDVLLALAKRRTPNRSASSDRTPRPAARQDRPSETTAVRSPSEPLPEQPDDLDTERGPSVGADMLVLLGLPIVGLVAVAVVLVMLLSPGDSSPAGAPNPEDRPASQSRAATTPMPNNETAKSKDSPVPQMRSAPRAQSASVVREIRAAIDGLAIDPRESAATFERAAERFQTEWAHMPRDRLRAASLALVEYVLRVAGSGEIGDRVIEIVASPSEAMRAPAIMARDIEASAWSVAMLTRLTRENDLPPVIRGRLERALSGALDGHLPGGRRTVEQGLVGALSAMPRKLTSPGDPENTRGRSKDAWSAWIEAVDAACAGDNKQRTGVLLRGLDVLLREAPDPADDPRVYEAVGLIIADLGWRAGDDSRVWVVRAFDARSVTNSDMEAVTAALATRSSAEGIDVTMVLRAGATERERVELRDRYARVWGVEDAPGRDRLAQDWIAAARSTLREQTARDAPARLDAALRISRLSEVGALRWSGAFERAEQILEDVNNRSPGGGFSGRGSAFGTDDTWAIEYLGVQKRVTERLELLAQLARRGSRRLSAMDAEVLALEAVRGSPARVREAAHEVAMRFADQAPMVNALLELLPRMPRTRANAQLVSAAAMTPYRKHTAPDWAFESRRALVARLLEQLASEGEFGRIDDASRELAESYLRRALPTDADAEPPDTPDAAVLLRRWRRAADTVPGSGAAVGRIDDSLRALDGRKRLAQGPVQRFHAEQLGAFEFMAYVVSAESPDRAIEIAEIRDTLRESRRRAGDVFTQILETERAMLRLWLIREGAR